MEATPGWMFVMLFVFVALLVLVFATGVWRRENWWAFGHSWRRNGRPPVMIATCFIMTILLLLMIFRHPAAATGDPRHRGGYSPAEQKELVE
jgi:hypothetical protein